MPKLPKMRLSANPLSIIGQRAGYATSEARAQAIGGVTRSYLLRCERGAQMPSQELIERMAQVYARPVEDIQDRKSTRLNSSHVSESRMPSSA